MTALDSDTLAALAEIASRNRDDRALQLAHHCADVFADECEKARDLAFDTETDRRRDDLRENPEWLR